MAFLRKRTRARTVGVAIFLPYLESCRAEAIHDQYVRGDVRHLPFEEKSFETVLCIEVLEHLEKAEGRAALFELERVARRQVILTTPVGRFHLPSFDGNPYQEHRSSWMPQELRDRGYSVIGHGIRGLGELIAKQNIPVQLLRPFLYLAWVAAGPVVQRNPEWSGDMVAIKDLGKPSGG